MRKKPVLLVLALLLAALAVGCNADGRSRQAYDKQLFAMDTVMTLTAYGPRGEEALAAAAEEVNRLDALWSVGRADSEISRINAAGGGTLSEDSRRVLTRALSVWADTGGLFDVTVYPLMDLWGFTGDHPQVPDQGDIDALLPLVDAGRVTLSQEGQVTLEAGQKLDLGGIAKGYASTRLMELFREMGVKSAIVSLGGNVQVLGTKPDGSPWRIGVRDPLGENASDYLGVLSVTDRAVVTAGGYERYFEENGKTYVHILDPRTGYPAQGGLLSATVISSDGALADALSTVFYIMGPREAASYWRERSDQFDLVLVGEDGRVYVTAGVMDSFQTDRTVVPIQP